jgi:hypothetical protein
MLCNKLKPTIQSKHKGRLSEGVLMLHDNAHPHMTAAVVQIILSHLKVEVLALPPVSQDGSVV